MSSGMPKVVNVDMNFSSPWGDSTRVSNNGGSSLTSAAELCGAGRLFRISANAGLLKASRDARCQATNLISSALLK
ncbi:hypothetical protein D3C78_1168450 [compost metagenome]